MYWFFYIFEYDAKYVAQCSTESNARYYFIKIFLFSAYEYLQQ